jgi:hypothetical protein
MNDLGYFQWRINNVGKIDDIHSIVVMVENKIKTTILFDNNNREKFKKTNYIDTII